MSDYHFNRDILLIVKNRESDEIARATLLSCGLFGWIIYGRIRRTASISRSGRSVKLISAVKRVGNGKIGAGILDRRIFESIIGNTASGRSADRQRPSYSRSTFILAFTTFRGESSFRHWPHKLELHRRRALGKRKLVGDTLTNWHGDRYDWNDWWRIFGIEFRSTA